VSTLLALLVVGVATALFTVLRRSPPGLSIVALTSPPTSVHPLSIGALNLIRVASDTSVRVAIRSDEARRHVLVTISVAPWDPTDDERVVIKGAEVSLRAKVVKAVTLTGLWRLLPGGAWGVKERIVIAVRDLDRDQGQTLAYTGLFALS
jgi:hypothetical protein